MKQKELISVIMPVYNSERYVKEAVQSILCQTYTNFEFIIIDDGSTDNSIQIIKQFDDCRIKLFTREHKGIVEQLNFGLKEAKSEFIARMDADDVCDKKRFEKQIYFLQSNKDIQLVGTNFRYINQFGKIISYKRFPEKHEEIEFMMPINASILHSTILTYKNVFAKVGEYQEKSWIAEDHELLLRILRYGIKCNNLQELLYSYRVHNDSISFRKQNETSMVCYNYGADFINFRYNQNSFEYLFQMGLLEYYKGDLTKARYYLKKAKKLTLNKMMIWRYLIFTFLGNKLISFLRRKKILWKISFFINKVFKIDLHLVRNRILF